jgi:hypothetical protein
LIEPFDSSNKSKLRQIMSLSAPLVCLQFHRLQTSWEIKRLLPSGCASITFLMRAMSETLMERPLYVVISSIPDTIYYQEVERKPYITKFWKKFGQMEKIPVQKRHFTPIFWKDTFWSIWAKTILVKII